VQVKIHLPGPFGRPGCTGFAKDQDHETVATTAREYLSQCRVGKEYYTRSRGVENLADFALIREINFWSDYLQSSYLAGITMYLLAAPVFFLAA